MRGIKKCRCDERLQTKTKEFTRLPYTVCLLLIDKARAKGAEGEKNFFFFNGKKER